MSRLRRYLPGLVGLALAGVVLWRGAAVLEREANSESAEPFALRVAAPSAVIRIAADPRADQGRAPERLTWRGHVTPIHERARVQVRVDGAAVELGGDPASGELAVDLGPLREQPGWHFVEVGLERRGGRAERIVDAVLIGDFAEPNPATATETEPGWGSPCAAVASVSPELIDALLRPLIEDKLLPTIQANEYMGADAAIEKATLELGQDSFSFEFEVAGINTLEVAGTILVRPVDDRHVHAELVGLTKADFRGKLRNQVRGAAAGGGALIGGLIAGPLAPVGAAAGWFAADRVVANQARKQIRAQIEDGLAELDALELLPSHVELVAGHPASRVAIGFCELTRVAPTGIHAGVYAIPDPPADGPRLDLGVPGPLVTGAQPTNEPLTQGEHARVELSVDAVNLLITAWTQSGLLTALIGERQAIARANAELEAWTPLRLAGLRPTRPPAFTPAGGPADGWRYGVGGLAIAVEGVDAAAQTWGEIYVAGAGELRPVWDAEAQTLSLAGSLDTLAVTCVRPDPDSPGAGGPILHGCFADVLDAAEVRQRIDERLRPGASAMPDIALGRLLGETLGVHVDALTLSRPRPGVLRLSAGLSRRDP